VEAPEASTPAHFIINKKLIGLPDSGAGINENTPLARRWREVQKIAKTFEIRLRNEYLHTMKKFTRWKVS
jgi:hypothetical protein